MDAWGQPTSSPLCLTRVQQGFYCHFCQLCSCQYLTQVLSLLRRAAPAVCSLICVFIMTVEGNKHRPVLRLLYSVLTDSEQSVMLTQGRRQVINIHTVSTLSVGEVRGDLHQTSLVDTHPHQSFVHPFDQLLLANKHVVRAATVVTETDGAQLTERKKKNRQNIYMMSY